MGQEQSKMGLESMNLVSTMKRDPRLVEKFLFLPELFPQAIQSQIKNIQKVLDKTPYHPLFQTMIDGIDDRFSHVKTEKNKQKKISWFQLKDLNQFLFVLAKIQRNKHVENSLMEIVHKNYEKKKRITLRKKINVEYESKQNLNLFTKIFLHYYIILMKKYFSSKDQEEKKIMSDFHKNIGKMVCQMIQNQHVQKATLTELAYKVVFIEKCYEKESLKQILNEIKTKFWPIYLRKQHSITLSSKEYDRIRQITQCYLDQMYLYTLKEAQDPEIISQDDSLGPIKNFPITKIKRK